jgi:FtsH ternary system domain X3-analog
MATLIVRLEVDPTTRKKNVVIKYESDSDALPMEHEEQHKRLVEQLVASGALKPGDLGDIKIEREAPPPLEGEKAPEAPSGDARTPVKQGR